VEVALFGGEDFLGELSQLEDGNEAMKLVHRHDMSLWFTEELDPAIAHNMPFEGVSDNGILAVRQTVDGISGRENLSQASEINQEVKILSGKINNAISDFDATTKKASNIEKALKKYNKLQAKFLKAIDNIRKLHQVSDEPVQYDLLSEAEKRVFEMSFVIAKIQYTILASCILTQSNGGDADDSDLVINTANSVYKSIRQDSFKMNGDDLEVSNIIWKTSADTALLAGFAASAICIILMIAQLASKNLIGLAGLGGAVVAFPVFFRFKNLSQSRLCLWRYIRIALAVIVVATAEIIRLVV
jgi:hypothetical protein